MDAGQILLRFMLVMLAFAVTLERPCLSRLQPLERGAIRAVMPAAIECIEQLERERGHRFTDDELSRVINSADFERRLIEHVKDDPAFAPCRFKQCKFA